MFLLYLAVPCGQHTKPSQAGAHTQSRKEVETHGIVSFEVVLRVQKDPAKQLYYTTPGVAEELRSIFNTDGAFKAQITLKVTFKKKKISGDGEEFF